MPKKLLWKQAKAQRLIEIFGLSQKEIAGLIKVEAHTVSRWVHKFGWVKNKEFEQKERQAAKKLVLIEGYTFEAAGKKMGVSGATIRQWANADLWGMGLKFTYPNKQQRRFVLTEFIKWVSKERPDLSAVLEDFSNSYNNYIEHTDS